MSKNASDGELAGLLEELGAVTDEARKVFGGLSVEQVNWKPAPEEWSVGQCFEHLIKTNGGFFHTLEQIARGERKSRAWERWSPFSGFFGRVVRRALEPGAKRKFKAPPGIRPSSSGVGADIVERFVEQQGRLKELMRATEGVNLKKTFITSPISGFVTYSLLDGYRIVVAHERRHFEQARRVTQAPGFPASVSSSEFRVSG
jgi:hypothetical protein